MKIILYALLSLSVGASLAHATFSEDDAARILSRYQGVEETIQVKDSRIFYVIYKDHSVYSFQEPKTGKLIDIKFGSKSQSVYAAVTTDLLKHSKNLRRLDQKAKTIIISNGTTEFVTDSNHVKQVLTRIANTPPPPVPHYNFDVEENVAYYLRNHPIDPSTMTSSETETQRPVISSYGSER